MTMSSRTSTLLALASAAALLTGGAQAKRYAPPKDAAATATVRFVTTNSAVRTSGRNYSSVAAFAPERCHETRRKQASMAYMNMRNRSENAVDAQAVEAGKPIALSFFYLGITHVALDGAFDVRQCIVDGVATFAPGDRVVARFEIDDEVSRCKVTFTSEAEVAPPAPSTFAMYPKLCWPEDSDLHDVSGQGFKTHTEVQVVPVY
jgi:hypothetical protein